MGVGSVYRISRTACTRCGCRPRALNGINDSGAGTLVPRKELLYIREGRALSPGDLPEGTRSRSRQSRHRAKCRGESRSASYSFGDLHFILWAVYFFHSGHLRSSHRGLPARRLARNVNLLDQAHQTQQADQAISRVKLPPAQPVSGRAWEGVMIVVPAFPQGEQGDPPEIRRVVPRPVVAVAPKVGGTVDEPGRVVEQRRAH